MTRQDFITRMVGLANMIQGFTLSREMLKLYEMQLAPLGFDKVCVAMDEIIGNRGTRDPFPSIKEIKQKINPQVSDESQAIEAVSRIVASVSVVGPYEVGRAKDRIGSLGWMIVERSGGWANICQSLTYDNMGVMKAQWKREALALIERAKAGVTEGPSLPPPDKPRGGGKLTSMEEILKLAQLKSMPGIETDKPQGRKIA